MANKREIRNTDYLLVSDSNESSYQLDSKKLKWSEFRKLAQEYMFTRNLHIMEHYLSNSQFNRLYEQVKGIFEQIQSEYDQVKDIQQSGKLRAVRGQVILLYADALPSGKSPLEYVESKWLIPEGCRLIEIDNCFLRGMTKVSGNIISGQPSVSLDEQTMPQHMHHSGITRNAKIQTINGVDESSSQENEMVYDMFQRDDFHTGIGNSELSEVVGNFSALPTGKTSISHNNIPNCASFYAFEVTDS